jgi:hypothetical protein
MGRKINFILTTRQGVMLDKLSEKTEMNTSEIIRRAIDEYLLNTGKELIENEDCYKSKN